jgi:hypothetical protein
MEIVKNFVKDLVGNNRHISDIESEISRQGSNWSAGERNAYAHARMSAEIALEKGKIISQFYGDVREYQTTSTFYSTKKAKDDFRADTYRDLWNNYVGLQIAEHIKNNDLSQKDIDRLVKLAMKNGDLITSIKKSAPDPRLPPIADGKSSSGGCIPLCPPQPT